MILIRVINGPVSLCFYSGIMSHEQAIKNKRYVTVYYTNETKNSNLAHYDFICSKNATGPPNEENSYNYCVEK